MSTTHTTRTYPNHDVLDAPQGGKVAHLSGKHALDEWGNWYTLCGRIVPAYRAANLADTDHARICAGCHRKATRRTAR